MRRSPLRRTRHERRKRSSTDSSIPSARYIDLVSGLLQGEVAFLTATFIVIDMTIAGLYWARAMRPARART